MKSTNVICEAGSAPFDQCLAHADANVAPSRSSHTTGTRSSDDVVVMDRPSFIKFEEPKLAGKVAYKSPCSQNRPFGLDWALVELSETSVAALEQREKAPTFNLPTGIVEQVDEDGDVLTVIRDGGKMLGTLSSSPALVRLPESNAFEELWVMRIKNNFLG